MYIVFLSKQVRRNTADCPIFILEYWSTQLVNWPETNLKCAAAGSCGRHPSLAVDPLQPEAHGRDCRHVSGNPLARDPTVTKEGQAYRGCVAWLESAQPHWTVHRTGLLTGLLVNILLVVEMHQLFELFVTFAYVTHQLTNIVVL